VSPRAGVKGVEKRKNIPEIKNLKCSGRRRI
jgi:hypothetical protein